MIVLGSKFVEIVDLVLSTDLQGVPKKGGIRKLGPK